MTEEELPLPSGYPEKLRMASALIDMDQFSRREVVKLADDILNEGYYDDLLLGIIDSNPSDWWKVYGLFEQFFNKHGIRSTDEQSAQLIVLEHYLKLTKDTECKPDICFFGYYGMIGSEEFYKICDRFKSLRDLITLCHSYFQYVGIEVETLYWVHVREHAAEVLADPQYQAALSEALKLSHFEPSV